MSKKSIYQEKLDKIIEEIMANKDVQTQVRPKLLLHACCAPCSSYCMEYLRDYFDITIFFYNPNITELEEYEKRRDEEIRLIKELNKSGNHINYLIGDYTKDLFFEATKGYEKCPEGGDRCRICFALRLDESARQASLGGFDYFTTSLTISPLKNAALLNELGENLGKKRGVSFLPSDFKKKGGYQRSIEMSAEYNLYRQDYCGCVFSKRANYPKSC